MGIWASAVMVFVMMMVMMMMEILIFKVMGEDKVG